MINLNTVLIKSSREESIRVTDNTYTIDLISPETIRKIECMTDLSMTYEEAYKTLENYFNLIY